MRHRHILPTTALLVTAMLAGCGERVTGPVQPAARAGVEKAAPSALSSIVAAADVYYGTLHGQTRLYNSAITATSSGTFSGVEAYVQPGSSITVSGNWSVGPITDVSYCPFCIVQEYVAWFSDAAAAGASPVNLGLHSGILYPTNPGVIAAGGYTWSTSSPNTDGEYFIGKGGTLDYYYQPWAIGGTGGLPPDFTVVAASYRLVVDGTAPTITYAGSTSYDVSDNVAITCTAADAGSGIVSTDCADVSGSALSFGLGNHTVTSSATDRAANVGNGAVTFSVNVTTGGVCALATAWSSNAGVANSICAKLRAAENANTPQAKAGALKAALNELSAQSGKKFTAAQAAQLAALIALL